MSDLPPPSAPQTGKPRRGLRIALVLSLMVNLLVIGVLAGGVMRVTGHEAMMPGQPDIRALWRAMPDSVRDELRSMARGQGFAGEPGPRPSREDRRARAAEINARILAGLRTEPFDTEGFARLMEGDREAINRHIDAANAAIATALARLTPPERQAMAERLERRLREPRR